MAFKGQATEICEVLSEAELLEAGDGELSCRGVYVDSRELQEGGLFVARRGEEQDGHKFLPDALSAGANVCFVDREFVAGGGLESVDRSHRKGKAFIVVPDTTKALGELARFWRFKLDLPTLAVTGSNGKTTTKTMLAILLQACVGKGTSNFGSFNNHVGLPLTILSAGEDDRWLVLEAGMNHSGELDYLGTIAEPDVAAITNIGPAHLGFFDSVAAVADAKCELLAHVQAEGALVLNADDAVLADALERNSASFSGRKRVFFGREQSADFSLSGVKPHGFNGLNFEIAYNSKCFPGKLPIPGEHNALNAVCALACSKMAFPELEMTELLSALGSFEAPTMRMNISELDSFTLVDDCYNANPRSVAASLETLETAAGQGNFVVVLGDMLELGDQSEAFHYEVGQKVAKAGAFALFCYGNFAKNTIQGAQDAGLGLAKSSDSIDEIVSAVRERLSAISEKSANKPAVLIKGSRGMRLERVVKGLSV